MWLCPFRAFTHNYHVVLLFCDTIIQNTSESQNGYHPLSVCLFHVLSIIVVCTLTGKCMKIMFHPPWDIEWSNLVLHQMGITVTPFHSSGGSIILFETWIKWIDNILKVSRFCSNYEARNISKIAKHIETFWFILWSIIGRYACPSDFLKKIILKNSGISKPIIRDSRFWPKARQLYNSRRVFEGTAWDSAQKHRSRSLLIHSYHSRQLSNLYCKYHISPNVLSM